MNAATPISMLDEIVVADVRMREGRFFAVSSSTLRMCLKIFRRLAMRGLVDAIRGELGRREIEADEAALKEVV